MAQPTTFSFGKGTIEVGDGATPDVFSKVCGFKSIEMSLKKDTNDTTVPDCDDPDAPAWKQRDVTSIEANFKCSGVLAAAALPIIEAAFMSGPSVSVRIRLIGAGVGAGTPDKLYSGKYHCQHNLKGQRGNKWEAELSGESDGVVTIADVAAV